MPKFEKGSQEAKDYMASLRAKRMSGGKMPQPPRDEINTFKDPKPENWEQPPRRPPVAIRPPVRIRPPPIRRITNTDAPNPFEGNGLMSDIVGTVKQTAKKTRKIINKTAESVKTVAQGGRDDYPPSVRKLLKTNGEKKIVSAIINRKPVEKKLSGLLNVLSLGQFKKNIENEPYDDLFHLSIVLRTEDGKDILVEKNEVINMAMKGRKGGENLPITPFPSGKTLNEIMENTKKRMGDKFFGYSARNNNCQDFIMALLQSNGIGDANDFTFVKQDAKQMFKGLGTLSKVADFITDLGGTANVLIKGAGGRSSKIAMVSDMNAEMPVIMKQKGTAKRNRPEKEKIIMVDESRWKQQLELLKEQQEEILNALFEIGNKPSEQKKYDKMDMKLNMLNEEIKLYENAIKGKMSGKGAGASVPNEEEEIYDDDAMKNVVVDLEEDIVDVIKENVLKKVSLLINKVGREKVKQNISDDEITQLVNDILNEEVDIVYDYIQSGNAPADFDYRYIPFYTGENWKKFRKLMTTIKRRRTPI